VSSQERQYLVILYARVLTLRLVLAVILLCFEVTPGLAGQNGPEADQADAPMPFERGAVEISILGGTSLPVPLFRANPDNQISMASFQVGRVMSGATNGNNLELVVDGTPFIFIRQPDGVKGWSVSPLFIRWNFPPAGHRGARIFGEIAGGLLFTTAPVPVRTTTFNFIDQAGFGVRIEESERRAWLVGYRFVHVSNGGRVRPNPGANFNFVYLAVSFVR
jgi:Lipid A 3-O-deacylase (PagL)